MSLKFSKMGLHSGFCMGGGRHLFLLMKSYKGEQLPQEKEGSHNLLNALPLIYPYMYIKLKSG